MDGRFTHCTWRECGGNGGSIVRKREEEGGKDGEREGL
jgi:hypothetical protein